MLWKRKKLKIRRKRNDAKKLRKKFFKEPAAAEEPIKDAKKDEFYKQLFA
eukprot:CAMPEP_0202965040 /NCGR_PEP_ID=MMETSP1396-20130829/9153_1 /ASSEMBLY_ACC=CAM_ASM_000872 /TAXON_ID= /ORGANISM="Pseudokeronopsis sp., Strain Brazil" /LENGTH=49 /DNA_ID=CAMNT_0049687631 /DNA_START=56 /DNA_END=205 /DNA_ORIENTATION=-